MKSLSLTICFLLAFSLEATAGDLFGEDPVLKVELEGPLNTLVRAKEDRQAYPFVLRSGGLEQQVMVSARGNSRMEICSFPPLRFEFGEGVPEQSVFSGQKALKLVSHCHASLKAQSNALKEYAAYRIFALLSEAAFRVRLLQIAYKDTDGRQDITRYGYLIEPLESLATRVGGEVVSVPRVSLKTLNDQQEAMVYIFQYVIGNTDWSLAKPSDDDQCCHNGKLVSRSDGLFYIPYDFDLSGLVNADYAHPNASLSISRVTQRLYRGFCLDQAVIMNALQTVVSHRDDIISIVDNLPALTDSERQKTRRFLERFFDSKNLEKKMQKMFERSCND